MNKRMQIVGAQLGLWVCLLAVLLCSGITPAGATTFKVATLSPGGSSWVKAFKSAADTVAKETDGRIKFRFYPGGIMGNDTTVLRKMKIGQLQGGALSIGSIYNAYPDGSIYGIPFMFDNLKEVDYVRRKLDAPTLKNADATGYVLLGMAEGGFAYIMSKEPIHQFDDLKARKVWVPEGDQQSTDLLKELGITPIPLGLGDVLTGLQTGLIDTVAASPVAAIAMQWHTQIKYVTTVPLMYLVGTIALNKKDFARLSQADQATVRRVFGQTFEEIDKQNRQDNTEAMQALAKQGITLLTPTGADRTSWQDLAPHARSKVIAIGTYSKAMVSKLQNLLDDYRAGGARKASAQ